MFELSADDDKELTIPDVQPVIIKHMLEFIYCNVLGKAYVNVQQTD